MDTAERQSLAEAFEHAAGQLDGGVDRLLVEESLRKAIAQQPKSGQWAKNLDTILQHAVGFLGLAERLGLGAVMAILGYKIIIKIIDVFGPPLLARLNTHDAEVQATLSQITKKVSKIDAHLSSAAGETTNSKQ